MTTRLELNVLCRRRLDDVHAPQVFSDEQINQWINDGIEDYSGYFPRQKTQAITTGLGDRTYDLNTDFQAVVSVEYPAGQDPPAYLRELDYRSAQFWQSPGNYWVVRRSDAGNPDELWISANPPAGQSITVEYLADHDFLDDDADAASLPERSLEVLVLFVRWKATEALALGEAANPDPNNILIGNYEVNRERAEKAYYRKVREAQRSAAKTGFNPWRMDKWG